MPNAHGETDAVLARLVRWAESQPQVRALLLESSRAVTGAALDAFSDYDVLVAVADARPFADDDSWLSDFGPPLVKFRDVKIVRGVETFMRLVLYRDGTKIDYAVWPAELLRQVTATGDLPDLLDWGYRALLDKDGLATGLPAPTRTAHIPPRPSEREYLALVEEFWWETTYVAKNLWRDALLNARYSLDVVMRYELLLKMLEWRVEIDRGWSWKPGVVGRGLKRHMPADLWRALEATYAGAGIEENWRALFATTTLFRRAASEVGAALGCAYPAELDRDVTAYLERVRATPHRGEQEPGTTAPHTTGT